MGVIIFNLEDRGVMVNSNDHENVRKYFMQTTEMIKSDSIADCLRTNLLSRAGIMEEDYYVKDC